MESLDRSVTTNTHTQGLDPLSLHPPHPPISPDSNNNQTHTHIHTSISSPPTRAHSSKHTQTQGGYADEQKEAEARAKQKPTFVGAGKRLDGKVRA
jgi:hypothetical protein